LGSATQTAYRTATISLADAFQLVVDGKLAPLIVYSQLPVQIAQAMNDAARAGFNREFFSLSQHEQTVLFAELLASVKKSHSQPDLSSSPKSTSTTASKPKRWWQFWR